jgi:hypothetical protein
MDNVHSLNSDLYVVVPSTTRASASLVAGYGADAKVIITNDNSQAVYVTSGVTEPSPAFPSSASTPVSGKVVLPGMMASFDINQDIRFITLIQSVPGAGNVYINVGPGV